MARDQGYKLFYLLHFCTRNCLWCHVFYITDIRRLHVPCRRFPCCSESERCPKIYLVDWLSGYSGVVSQVLCFFLEGRGVGPTDMFEVFRRYPRIMMIGTCDWSVANGAAFKSLPSIVKQTRAMRRDTSCHGDCSEANNTPMCMLHMCIDIFPSDRRKASLLKAVKASNLSPGAKKRGAMQKVG